MVGFKFADDLVKPFIKGHALCRCTENQNSTLSPFIPKGFSPRIQEIFLSSSGAKVYLQTLTISMIGPGSVILYHIKH